MLEVFFGDPIIFLDHIQLKKVVMLPVTKHIYYLFICLWNLGTQLTLPLNLIPGPFIFLRRDLTKLLMRSVA